MIFEKIDEKLMEQATKNLNKALLRQEKDGSLKNMCKEVGVSYICLEN